MDIYSTPYTLSPGSKNKKFGEVRYARFSEADGVPGLFKMGSAPYVPHPGPAHPGRARPKSRPFPAATFSQPSVAERSHVSPAAAPYSGL